MKSQSTTKSKEVTNSIRKMDPANLQRMNNRPMIRRAIVKRLQMIQTNSHPPHLKTPNNRKMIKRLKSNRLISLQAILTLPLVAIVSLSPDSDKISISERSQLLRANCLGCQETQSTISACVIKFKQYSSIVQLPFN